MGFVSWTVGLQRSIGGREQIPLEYFSSLLLLNSFLLGIFLFRLYWICVLVASFTGMITIFIYTIDTYADGSISIHFDTSYLEWNNTFPAISFCMQEPTDPYSKEKIRSFLLKYYAEQNFTEPNQ